jgi:hypothetical protein
VSYVTSFAMSSEAPESMALLLPVLLFHTFI